MNEKQKAVQVSLRALEPEDIDLLYTWENDRQVWQVSHTLTPFSRYILEKYLENSHLDIYQTRQLRLMIDLPESGRGETTVGAVDLFDFDPFHLRAGVGILIYGEENKNKGIATAALRELKQYAFSVLHLHQLYCNIAADNDISLKLFKSAGFEIIGVKKDWLKRTSGFENEVLMQLISPAL